MSLLKKVAAFSQNKLTEFVAFILFATLIICGTLGKDLVTDYLKNKEWSVHELKVDATRHQKVQELITELRVRTGGSRVVISLFHNGGFYSSGVPYKKTSIIYETCEFGIAPITQESQSIPLSQVSDVLKELASRSGPFFINTISMNQGVWKYTLMRQGVDSAYYCRISQGEKIIGYIAITYGDQVKVDKKIEELIDVYSHLIQIHLDGWE